MPEYDPLSLIVGPEKEAAAVSRARTLALRRQQEMAVAGLASGEPSLQKAAEAMTRGGEAEGELLAKLSEARVHRQTEAAKERETERHQREAERLGWAQLQQGRYVVTPHPLGIGFMVTDQKTGKHTFLGPEETLGGGGAPKAPAAPTGPQPQAAHRQTAVAPGGAPQPAPAQPGAAPPQGAAPTPMPQGASPQGGLGERAIEASIRNKVMTPEAKKQLDAAEELIVGLRHGLAAVRSRPVAFGPWKEASQFAPTEGTAALVRQYQASRRDPMDTAARAAVFGDTYTIVRQLAGAAFTKSEAAHIYSFLPDENSTSGNVEAGIAQALNKAIAKRRQLRETYLSPFLGGRLQLDDVQPEGLTLGGRSPEELLRHYGVRR